MNSPPGPRTPTHKSLSGIGGAGDSGGDGDPGVELMLRWQGGDDAAFEELVHQFSGHVYSLLTRFLGRSHGGREDLVQEVFLRVFRARERYEPTARLSTWLYSICWRISINESERQSRRRTVSLDGAMDRGPGKGGAFDVEDVDGDLPESSMEQADLVRCVRRAIAALPNAQRAALVLSRYHDLSYGEIAQVIDSTEKAVKSLVHRARQNLRETLLSFTEEEDYGS